jgi:hypothetical protein
MKKTKEAPITVPAKGMRRMEMSVAIFQFMIERKGYST